jgi:hypothetical protein
MVRVLCRWVSPRMLSIQLFTSLHPNVQPDDPPSLVRGQLKQCTTAEVHNCRAAGHLSNGTMQ